MLLLCKKMFKGISIFLLGTFMIAPVTPISKTSPLVLPKASAAFYSLNSLLNSLAAFGVPGLILITVMAFTGLSGAAALTAALAILGGPGGMIGGIAVLGLIGGISYYIAREGADVVIDQYIDILKDRGYTKEGIIDEIQDFSPMLISQENKDRAIGRVIRKY